MEEHFIFQINFLSELVDETYSELFSTNFSSLSDFYDTYSCDACTDTHLCSIYAETEAALQVDITFDSSIDSSIDTPL